MSLDVEFDRRKKETVISSTDNIESVFERLRDGDKEALADLFARFHNQLYCIVNRRLDRRLAQRVDADDILQNVYLDAAERIQFYSHSSSFFVWLKLIVAQTMADTFRRHLGAQKRDANREISIHSRSGTGTVSTPIESQLSGRSNSPDHDAMRAETAAQLGAAIDRLKAIDSEVIQLRHFEELQNKEVAEVLGIGEKAASIRYTRALARLKEVITEIPELVDGNE